MVTAPLNFFSRFDYVGRMVGRAGQGMLCEFSINIRLFYVLIMKLLAETLLSQSQSGKRKHKAVIAVVSVLLALLLIICLAAYVWRRKRQGKQCCCFLSVPDSSDEQYIVERTENEDLELPLFGLEMVVAATNNFSFENKLGEGGFGPVYLVIFNNFVEFILIELDLSCSC